jgi:hypothetical protein
VGYSSLLKTVLAIDAMTAPNANAMRQEEVIFVAPQGPPSHVVHQSPW